MRKGTKYQKLPVEFAVNLLVCQMTKYPNYSVQLLERGGSLSLPPLPSMSDSTSSVGDDEENRPIVLEPRPACKEDLRNIKVTFSFTCQATLVPVNFFSTLYP